MKKLITLITLLTLFLPVKSQGEVFVNSSEIEKIFQEKNIEGTFIVYDVNEDEFTGYNEGRSNKRYYPASTFKIFNSLIALSEGVVEDVDETFYEYDGSRVFLESWKNDANLREGIKRSQVPAYQRLAHMIGLEDMQKNIERLNFGNKDIGDRVDTFWLEGPLKISAKEQIKLLGGLAQGKLPYPKEVQEAVCEISKLESGRDWVLYGKTGWTGGNTDPSVGWFVGWVEEKGNIYSFAINMDMDDPSKLPMREEVAKRSLRALGLMK